MKKKPAKKASPKKSFPHFTYHEAGILLEQIRDEVQVVAEGVSTNTQQIETLSKKLEVVAEGVSTNTQQIGTLSKRLDEVAEDLRVSLVDVKQDLSRKIDRIDGRLDQHEEEIHHLKQAQNLS